MFAIASNMLPSSARINNAIVFDDTQKDATTTNVDLTTQSHHGVPIPGMLIKMDGDDRRLGWIDEASDDNYTVRFFRGKIETSLRRSTFVVLSAPNSRGLDNLIPTRQDRKHFFSQGMCFDFVGKEPFYSVAEFIVSEKAWDGEVLEVPRGQPIELRKVARGGACSDQRDQRDQREGAATIVTKEILHNGLCIGSKCECTRSDAAQSNLRQPDPVVGGDSDRSWPPPPSHSFGVHYNQQPFVNYRPAKPMSKPGKFHDDSRYCFFKAKDASCHDDKVRIVSTGRQLFVDNFLIKSMTTSVQRTFHQATFVREVGSFENSDSWDAPIDEYRWLSNQLQEEKMSREGIDRPYNDGVLWDDVHQRYMMYWSTGSATFVVFSKDGLNWRNRTATNLCDEKCRINNRRDTGSFFIDPFEKDPTKRFKCMIWMFYSLVHFTSPDGIVWKRMLVQQKGHAKDATCLHFNPFRKGTSELFFIFLPSTSHLSPAAHCFFSFSTSLRLYSVVLFTKGKLPRRNPPPKILRSSTFKVWQRTGFWVGILPCNHIVERSQFAFKN